MVNAANHHISPRKILQIRKKQELQNQKSDNILVAKTVTLGSSLTDDKAHCGQNQII